MIVRSRAPLRVSFGGGGTDVPPYSDERGGAVLSVTIDKYAYASLRTTDDATVSVRSLDYDVVAKYAIDQPLEMDGSLDLVKACLNRTRDTKPKQGIEVFLHSDAPPGSGLGSSSTMAVAVIGMMRQWKNLPLSDYEVAETALAVERQDLGIAGGKQDQYAAVFGGVNFIEFHKDTVIVNPLRIKPETINELQYMCLLAYTGKTRLSDGIIRKQQEGFEKQVVDVIAAMDEIKQIAVDMKGALLQGRLRDFAALLHAGWEAKKRMAGPISNPHINELYDIARQHGALGGKILGAGGGGYMLVMCEFDKKHIVAERMEKAGAQPVEFAFDHAGLQTWEVRE